jgi:hypothetical protein
MILIISIITLIILLNTKMMHISFLRSFGCINKHVRPTIIYKKYLSGNFKMINPSIVNKGNKLLCAMRYTSATTENLGLYIYHKFKPRSYVCIGIFKDSLIQRIVFPIFPTKYQLEDPRIITFNNKIYISITEYRSDKNIYPVMYELSKNLNITKRIEYKNYGNSSTIQKNWCPFIHKGSLTLHTDSYPYWSVYKVNITTGLLTNLCKINTVKMFKSYKVKNAFIRCSTSWIDFTKETYICGLHIKYVDKFLKRIPLIRSILMEIDKRTLIPIRASPVLCLDKEQHSIQFLSGLEIVNDKILLSVGIGDYYSVIYSISRYRVERILSEGEILHL